MLQVIRVYVTFISLESSLKDDIVVGITGQRGQPIKKAKAVREKMQALLEELEKDEDSYE